MTILELAYQAGLKPVRVASTAGGEYHSSCPRCGGNDRFYIQPHKQMKNCFGSYCCRQCGAYGDAIQFARYFLNYSFNDAAIAVNATINYAAPLLFTKNYQGPVALRKPPAEWIERSTKQVDYAHQALLFNKELLSYLESRGLPLKAVQQYKLGFINKDQFFEKEKWGLKDENKKALWMPRGLLIPSLESNSEVIRLKVRRSNWQESDKFSKYIAISGSMNGLNIVGSTKNDKVLVVESELDALALHFAMPEYFTVIAVGSCLKNPDNLSDHLARNAKQLIICHDNDQAGKKMFKKWQRFYSHAIACPMPIGKDIGEAIQNGFDVKQWLYERIL